MTTPGPRPGDDADEVLQRHLAALSLAGHRPTTLRVKGVVLRAFTNGLQPRTWRQATRSDVEAFLARPLAAKSRAVYLGHLRVFYRWAVEEELLEADPLLRVKPIRWRKGTPRPIAEADLLTALEHATPRMRAWLLLMALGGLRCMEVAALCPEDLTRSGDVWSLFLRECKGGGTASLPAHPAVVEALQGLRVDNGRWWDATAEWVSRDVSNYLRSLGIAATAHQLRHYAGTSWYRASGYDLLATARLLRHRNVATTQTYAQIDVDRPALVVQAVAVPERPVHAVLAEHDDELSYSL